MFKACLRSEAEGVETLQRLACEKEVDHEGAGILDFWRTSKSVIGINSVPNIQSTEFDQRGKYYRFRYSDLVEYFIPPVFLDRRISHL